MKFKEPFVVYTAASNLEAHIIVDMLDSNGIAALAVEDQSGVSLWWFGTISQFHKPKIWVERSTAVKAKQLIQQFEQRNREREKPGTSTAADIQVQCEECGKTTVFPGSLDGSIQECSHCGSFVDVGELGWDEDFGEPDK